MMKKLLAIILGFTAVNAQATTCLDLYIAKRDQGLLGSISEKSTIGGAAGTTIGMLAGSSAMMMVGFPVLMIGGGIMLTREARFNRVIDLLKDASEHSKTGGMLSPGVDLTRFYKKLRTDELTIMEVAQILTKANEDLSFCAEGNLQFYRSIKKQYQARFLSL